MVLRSICFPDFYYLVITYEVHRVESLSITINPKNPNKKKLENSNNWK